MNYKIAKQWLEARVHRTISHGSSDFEVMNELLKKHPDYNNWVNTDIEYFKITRSSGKKALQVYMKMQGISRPRLVSWTACVTGKKRKVDNLNAAMRTAIASQISTYTSSHPIKKCMICESYSNIEVDHYPKKFREIKKEFLEQNTEEIPSLYFFRDKYVFSNPQYSSFSENWYDFHFKQASYRYLCSTCNQQSH